MTVVVMCCVLFCVFLLLLSLVGDACLMWLFVVYGLLLFAVALSG